MMKFINLYIHHLIPYISYLYHLIVLPYLPISIGLFLLKLFHPHITLNFIIKLILIL